MKTIVCLFYIRYYCCYTVTNFFICKLYANLLHRLTCTFISLHAN